MHGEELHPAFCHHISRHGRVDAAGKEQHSPPGTADGQPARPLDDVGVDQRAPVLADVHPEVAVVFGEVHSESAERKHRAAECGGDLGRSHGDALIRALHRDAEVDLALSFLRGAPRCGGKGCADLREILIRTHRHLVRDGQRVYAEDLLQAVDELRLVLFREVFHEISALGALKGVFHAAQRPFDVAHEHGLEIITVLALQKELAEAYHNNSFHNISAFTAHLRHAPRTPH